MSRFLFICLLSFVLGISADSATYEPESTITCPDTTTYEPDTTSTPPDSTTCQPEPTSTAPDTTTCQPEPTSTPSDTTTCQPELTSTPSDSTTCQPEPTSTPPDSTTCQPEPTSMAPDTTTCQPEPTSTPPESTTCPTEPTSTSTEIPKLNCGPGEIQDNCPVDCPTDHCPRTVEESKITSCPRPKVCPPPQCKCGFNQRRNESGGCMSVYDCPKLNCDFLNEEFQICPSYCPGENCSTATADGNCPRIFGLLPVLRCFPTCRCIKSYYRINGTCRPYSECNRGGSPTTTTLAPEASSTTTVAPESNTTTTTEKPKLNCGPNEVQADCPNNSCLNDYCPKNEEEAKLKFCSKPKVCPPPRCVCGYNFRRSENGTCVPARSCPPFDCSKRPHEHYVAYPPFCSDSCDVANPSGVCRIFGRIGILAQYRPTCRCDQYYWRRNGTCISYDECKNITTSESTTTTSTSTSTDTPTTTTVELSSTTTTETPKLNCGPNEVQNNCPNTCVSENCPKNEDDAKPRYCPRQLYCPQPKCVCGLNYRRSENGTCIPARLCPPFDCSKRPHEHYVAYPPFCSDSCDVANPSGICHIIGRIGILAQYRPTCRCDQYYWRRNGTCISYDECKTNHSGNLENMPKVIRSPHGTKPIIILPRPKPKTTENYDITTSETTTTTSTSTSTDIPTTTTVELSSTTTTKKPELNCGPNEVQDDCPNTCVSEYCPKNENDAKPKPCPLQKYCPQPKCVCELNYRRSDNGTCMPAGSCPPFKCDRPNEEYVAFPRNCGDSCDVATPDGVCHIIGRIIFPVQFRPTCLCKKYYWRKYGICVSYAECKNTTTPQPDTTTPQPDTTTCRTDTTTTLPDSTSTSTEKPTLNCGPNEIQNNCPNTCLSEYCPKNEDDAKPRFCPRQLYCPKPKCVCRNNYRRSDNGTCISAGSCPPFKCNKPNEEYVAYPRICGDSCDVATPEGECRIIGRIGILAQYRPTCFCKKYYWRKNGTCVSYAECKNTTTPQPDTTTSQPDTTTCQPDTTTTPPDSTSTSSEKPKLNCGPNEIQNDCPDDCQSEYCPKNEEDTKPKPCLPQIKCPQPKCVCGYNYRRSDNGTCIPAGSCPPFKCNKPNEEYVAYPRICGDSCDVATPEGECRIIGRIGIPAQYRPTCFCKKYYWRQDGICVSYAECKNTTTPQPDTTTPQADTTTSQPDTTTTPPDSTSTSTEKPKLNCGPNEIQNDCPNSCVSEYCPKNENDAKPRPCALQLKCPQPKCVCRLNYRRCDNGTCIPAGSCPPFKCNKPNEEYVAYPRICGDSCDVATPEGECRIIGRIGILAQYRPTCFCKKYYWRENGICVSYAKCKNTTTPQPDTTTPQADTTTSQPDTTTTSSTSCKTTTTVAPETSSTTATDCMTTTTPTSDSTESCEDNDSNTSIETIKSKSEQYSSSLLSSSKTSASSYSSVEETYNSQEGDADKKCNN